MAEKENLDTLRGVLEGFNRTDNAAAAEALDPDVTYIIRGRGAKAAPWSNRAKRAQNFASPKYQNKRHPAARPTRR